MRDVLFQGGGRYLGAVLGIVRGLVIPKLLDPAMYGVFKSYQTLSELSRHGDRVGIPRLCFASCRSPSTASRRAGSSRLLDNGFWSTVLLRRPPSRSRFLSVERWGWIRFEDVHLTAWHLLFVPLLFVDRTKIFFDVVFTGQKQFVFQAKLRMFDEVATTILGVVGAWAFGFDGVSRRDGLGQRARHGHRVVGKRLPALGTRWTFPWRVRWWSWAFLSSSSA